MTKKKMYGCILFILFSFSLFTIALLYEINLKDGIKNKINLVNDKNKEAPIVDNTIGVSNIHNWEKVDGTNVDMEEFNNDIKDKNSSSEIENTSSLENENNEVEPSPVDSKDDVKNNIDLKDEEEITLAFTGDVLFSRHVITAYEKNGIDGVIGQKLLEHMKNADFTMVNQEFPFGTSGTQAKDKQYTFLVDPSYVKLLKELEVDMVSLANNHTLDFGQEPLLETLDLLEKEDILKVGAGRNLEEAKKTQYINMKGKKIAVLGASRVIPTTDWNATSTKPGLFTTYDPNPLYEEIKAAKETSDIVIVYVHWGIERDNYPKEYQRTMAKGYIDSGADLVIGTHPHVLQGIEYYNGKAIVYSLGNYIFNYSIDKTVLLIVDINKEDDMELSIIPAFADHGKTDIIAKEKESEFYQWLEGLSYNIEIIDGVVIPKE